jgi:predicted transcriptional regulator
MADHFATSLKLDATLKQRVQRLAQARLRSSHWLMCEAIREFVEREERREERRHAAIEAWSDYEVTGHHVNGAQADDWLAGLESGRDAEGVPCNT